MYTNITFDRQYNDIKNFAKNKKALTSDCRYAIVMHNKIRIMNVIRNDSGVQPEVTTNNDDQVIEFDINQQIVGVANENNLPVNQGAINDMPLDQRRLEQPDQNPVVNVGALVQQYQGLIECKDIGDGKYELTLSSEGISNEKAQEILEAFKHVNISKLKVDHCDELTALPIENLTNLTSLEVNDCDELTALPIQDLTNLTSLEVFNCNKLTALPIQGLTSLTSLLVSRCSDLTALPIQGLTSLTSLEVFNCNKLTALPIKDLTSLTSLEVFNCSIAELPIQDLTNLTRLRVNCCNKPTALPIKDLTSLTSLEVFNCSIAELPIQGLTNLTSLRVNRCSKLIALPIQNLANLTSLEVINCSIAELPIQDLTNLTSLEVSRCSELIALPIQNLANLTSLEVRHCPNLHGELDVSESQQLESISIENCADDFVVVISPECPLAQGLPANYPYVRIKGQPSIEEQCTSFLSNDEDKGVVQSVIDLVHGHNSASNDQRKDCLDFLKSYCERYVNASEEEKSIAAEKYMSALKDFKLYLNACRDAFATGLARLKIKLGLGELLDKCNTPEECRQVLFGVYTEEQIDRAIVIFDTVYQDLGHQGIVELLEVQLALNVVLNVPHSKNMSFARYSATIARAVTVAYNANANKLRNLVVPCETFLETHDDIMPTFLARARGRLELNENEAQSFEVPFKIVLTSMLKDGQKFNTFLLGEPEYWPLATGFSETKLTVDQLEVITGETDDTRAIKAFIQEHKGWPIDPEDPDGKKLSDNPTLADVFSFLDNNGMEDNELYEKVANMTSATNVAELQQRSIGNLYSETNYEARLAEHLQNALRSNEQQQVNVNQPENDEQMAERMQLEEYMNPLGNE